VICRRHRIPGHNPMGTPTSRRALGSSAALSLLKNSPGSSRCSIIWLQTTASNF